jgi:hypothetical protein
MSTDPDGKSQLHRPVPTVFPTTPDTGKPDWTTQFARTTTVPDNAAGSACYYPKLPTNTQPLPPNTCPMPTTEPNQ